MLVTEDYLIIDGHERWRAIREIGLTRFPLRIVGNLAESARVELAIRLNIERRHLTVAQRRELAARLLREDPRQSDRKVAESARCDHKTVGRVRLGLVSGGEIPNSTTATGKDGKTYRRPSSVGVETAASANEAASLFKRLGDDAPEGNNTLRTLRATSARKRREKELADAPATLPRNIKIYNCDFRDLKGKVEANSVDLALCDPPWMRESETLREPFADALRRVLKPGGWAAVYCGHFWLSSFFESLKERLDYRWIIAAVNADGSGAIRSDSVLNCWRPILLFQKGGRFRTPSVVKDVIMTQAREKDLYRHQQPLEEAVYLVSRLCPPGGLVCDYFVGSGTVPTAVALAKGGRRFVGSELDADRSRLARRRVAEAFSGAGNRSNRRSRRMSAPDGSPYRLVPEALPGKGVSPGSSGSSPARPERWRTMPAARAANASVNRACGRPGRWNGRLGTGHGAVRPVVRRSWARRLRGGPDRGRDRVRNRVLVGHPVPPTVPGIPRFDRSENPSPPIDIDLSHRDDRRKSVVAREGSLRVGSEGNVAVLVSVGGWFRPRRMAIPVGGRRHPLGRCPVVPEVLPQRLLDLVQPVLAHLVRLHGPLDPGHQLVDVRLVLLREPVGGLLQHLVVLVEAAAVQVDSVAHRPSP